MRHVVPLLVLCLASLSVRERLAAAEVEPYGIAKRTLWNDSRVVGSPEPPYPFRIVRAYPQLKTFQPIFVRAEPGSKRMFLVEHGGSWAGPGRILAFPDDPTATQPELIWDSQDLVYGFCFHPRYEQNRQLLAIVNGPVKAKPGEKKKNRIVRMTVNRDEAGKIDPESVQVILEWESNGHNGGDLGFGPDGYLYVPTGDGTSDSDTDITGQGVDDLLAVMIRIDVDHPDKDRPYSIPRDNPYVGVAGAREEIWAHGFRNPWRMYYDHPLNQLWVGQNGQDLWEQVFLVRKADNYGWSTYEGSYPFYLERKLGPGPLVKPTVEHPHSEARSLTGGVVYHGRKLPELRDAFVYGDFATGKIWAVKHDGQRVTYQREIVDTSLQIVGFGLDHEGELLVIDHGGALYYFEPTPTDTPPSNFPRKLSETGLFASVAGHKTHPGLIPFSVNVQLWSDGAHKERFIALPGDARMDYTSRWGFKFDEGSVLVKSFAIEDEAGNPRSRRWIETRLMVFEQKEWVGYSYRWNQEQTDAELVDKSGVDHEYTIRDAAAPLGQRQLKWHFPSRAECMVCHSRAAQYVLGVSEVQLNKLHDYGGVQANQLRTLEHLGVFKTKFWDIEQEDLPKLNSRLASIVQRSLRRLTGRRQLELSNVDAAQFAWDALGALTPLPSRLRPSERVWLSAARRLYEPLHQQRLWAKPLAKRPKEMGKLFDLADHTADIELRARSYLHANCAYCHVDAGGGNAAIVLDYFSARDRTKTVDVAPLHHRFGLDDARIVAAGRPDRSVLLHRLQTRGTGQMPPLATTQLDREAIEVIRQWIAQTVPEAPRDPK